MLPVSLVLATLRDTYVAGLTAFRFAGADDSEPAYQQWIGTFTDAVRSASAQAALIGDELAEIRERWAELLASSRSARGSVRALRSDSATAAVLADLPSTPVLTAKTVERIHGVSNPAALKALDELVVAGILLTRHLGQRRLAYLADDVLDLITHSERQLASTQFDTRGSAPNRPVPARPTKR